jgi:hypothetical protein
MPVARLMSNRTVKLVRSHMRPQPVLAIGEESQICVHAAGALEQTKQALAMLESIRAGLWIDVLRCHSLQIDVRNQYGDARPARTAEATTSHS